MAPSRFESMPPELKLETYSYFDYNDLLPLSHVSSFWRHLVLQDKRWNEWFELIVNPETGESIRDIMTRFKILDKIPIRTIVTLCFGTNVKCSMCTKNTSFLFLPLLRRICGDCLDSESKKDTVAVMCLSTALTTYDVSEKDLRDLIVLHWEETDPERRKKTYIAQAKLVSAQLVKNIAIEKHGGEDKLETHLQYKKERVQKAYDKRLKEYETAAAERKRLRKLGDKDGAAAVKNGKKALQKTRPKIPAVLKVAPFTPPFYHWISTMATTFVAPDAVTGDLVSQKLVQCKMCNVIANVAWQGLSAAEQKAKPEGPDFPELMLAGLIPEHEEEEHYALEGDACWWGCHGEYFVGRMCDVCLNAEALETKAELVRTGGWD
ncbi:hypothetical protein C8R46DRAFT_1099796, partial [Mycena filopes]